MIAFRLLFIPIMFSLILLCIPLIASDDMNDVHGIVYILPSKYCNSSWAYRYGDRIYFYVYSNLSLYSDGIEYYFNLISAAYNLVVIVIPADDTTQYRENLKTIDRLAGKYGLRVTWAVFPKSKYGREDTYLDPGIPMHQLVLDVIEYLASLNNTYHIALWYEWSYRINITDDLWVFYNILPITVKQYYAVWLDQPYLSCVYDINIIVPVYTEIYDPSLISLYTNATENQILVTGYQTHNMSKWLYVMHTYIESSKTNDIVVWIYYDLGDGHGEHYYAYKPEIGLGDPWNQRIIEEPPAYRGTLYNSLHYSPNNSYIYSLQYI